MRFRRFCPTAVFFAPLLWAQSSPTITLVANAEGDNPLIAPNTWVQIKGQNLANSNRIWLASDFVNTKMPTALDGVSVTVNGESAYVYYISGTQVNILTSPDALQGAVTVQVTNNGVASPGFSVQAQPLSPSFFVFNGGPYVLAQHGVDYSLLGPSSLFPGKTTPAKPGEVVVLYANGFGPTSTPVVSGSSSQSGSLSPLPVVTIGGVPADVQFAGLVSPGLFQFNVVIPANTPSGDNAVVATYNGVAASPDALITIQGSSPPPTTMTLYVSPKGNDAWSGTLPAANATNTDGPLATFDRARAIVQSISKTDLTQVIVQFRAGTYYLPATEMLGAADSGSAATQIVYQNYPGESPVISSGVRIQNWTNVTGNMWKTTLSASTQYFENLFYNGVRRLRPRLGGYLGTYYRVAATVYLNAPGPPATSPDPFCGIYVAGSGWECFDRFQYAASDPISKSWKNLSPSPQNHCAQAAGDPALTGDITLLDFEQFSTSVLRISCIDTTNQIVYLTGRTAMPANHYTETGFITTHRYVVENVQDALTLPGQWFLDRSTTPWTLTYLANSGENPNTDTVVIPQQPLVLVASSIQYVTFQGLTFEHNNYTVPAAGYISTELEPNIPSAVSLQNSQHVTFDSITVTQTAGSGIEIISCTGAQSPSWCVSNNSSAVTSNDVIKNSAFYDVGTSGIRVGEPGQPSDSDANVPLSTVVENNVVEGYGRIIPAAFGIGQGIGHDNLYTHNDVYDGYHCAISITQNIGDTAAPSGNGAFNNIISFNHVYNLLQGIMNDGGSIRFEDGNQAFIAVGNKMLNNKVHDVTDASIIDADGYGGNGLYMDNSSGLVDAENNLVYRVSGAAVYTPHGPALPGKANTIENNIFAYARLSMVSETSPYDVVTTPEQGFVVTNNIFYFDRNTASNPPFRVQGGCTYAAGFPYTSLQSFNSNLYWRTDGAFASDSKAFHVQPSPGSGPNPPCSDDKSTWTFYAFAGWQNLGQDTQSVIKNPGFANPPYPADDYSLPNGSPGVGFVVFDPNQAGRSNPVIHPPTIPATFVTKYFNPATDY